VIFAVVFGLVVYVVLLAAIRLVLLPFKVALWIARWASKG
jgi:hypothetical protein